MEIATNSRMKNKARRAFVAIKIKGEIAKVWGEEKKDEKQTLSIAAEPEGEYKKG